MTRPATEWVTVHEIEHACPLNTFQKVARQYITEPEHFSVKTILRAEVVDEIGDELTRLLVPRIHRENATLQRVIFEPSASNFTHVTFKPANEMAWKCVHDVPFHIPRVPAFRIGYEVNHENSVSKLRVEAQEFHDGPLSDPFYSDHLKHLLQKIVRFIQGNQKAPGGEYVKRVNHDRVVPKVMYQDRYVEIKEKYRYWIDEWSKTMQTDPHKHVYEDISITTFLICLWELEQKREGNLKKPRFVDIGCGNGFLVHILNKEGYEGYGIDISKRDLWESLDCDLRAETLNPTQKTFELDVVDDADLWLIGNHADEMTGWLPILAARTNLLMNAQRVKFFVLPCCFHDLNGRKNPFGLTIPHGKGPKYESYLAWVKNICESCGFNTETEWLRIPSTKNCAFIGRKQDLNGVEETLEDLLSSVVFEPRLSDREKTLQRLYKEKLRLEQNASHDDEACLEELSELPGFDLF